MRHGDSYEILDSAGELLADLGLQPVSNRFLPAGSDLEAPKFPFRILLSSQTGLIRLSQTFPIEALKPCYPWLTNFEPEDHLDALVERLCGLPGVTQETVFAGYSFKDDSTLRRLKERGYSHLWRIDPVQDLGVTDPCANVETYQAYLTPSCAQQISQRYGLADVLIVRHVLEHAYNLPSFIEALRHLVSPSGYIVWEVPDCERALEAGESTILWEEHLFYFTRTTLCDLLHRAGFVLCYEDSVPYPLENSLILITKSATSEEPPTIEPEVLAQEVKRAQQFPLKVSARKQLVRQKLEAFRQQRGPIALFGAGHLAVAFLSLMEVVDLVDYVIDDNPHKKGMWMPLGQLKIIGSDILETDSLGLCLLSLNPLNQPKVMERHRGFTQRGGLFASIFSGSAFDLIQVL